MATKKLKEIHSAKATYTLFLGIVFGLICISALRHNYQVMTKLRDDVSVADQNNGDVETALTMLRSHVYGHMNTNLISGSNPIKPPIQLKYRYERLAATESDKVKTANAKVTSDAEIMCTSQFPAAGYNPDRVVCIQNYVNVNATSESTVAESLYKFDFISPKWSPDTAGITMLISIFSFIASAVLIIIRQIKKRLL